MSGLRSAGLVTLLLLALLAAGPRPAAGQGTVTGAAQLAQAYAAIFDADFERVTPTAMPCTAAPAEACDLLGVVALWWQIQADPHNRRLDPQFLTRADAVIAAIEGWTVREPQRAESWFFLGGALGARAQWRVLRGERLAAARDGKRIKEALERALLLDPALHDAYIGLGLYRYYAAVAPAAARMLRWLLLLPGGDRRLGLEELLKGRSTGVLLRDEADYQLHLIYLWYEKQPARAIELLAALDERHPRNPHFLQLIAEIQDYQLRDFPAALRSYQLLQQRVEGQRVNMPALAAMHARLGLGRLTLPEDALAHNQAVIDARPAAPVGAVAQAYFQRGQMLERLARASEAIAAYRAAIAESPAGDPLRTRDAARRAIRRLQ